MARLHHCLYFSTNVSTFLWNSYFPDLSFHDRSVSGLLSQNVHSITRLDYLMLWFLMTIRANSMFVIAVFYQFIDETRILMKLLTFALQWAWIYFYDSSGSTMIVKQNWMLIFLYLFLDQVGTTCELNFVHIVHIIIILHILLHIASLDVQFEKFHRTACVLLLSFNCLLSLWMALMQPLFFMMNWIQSADLKVSMCWLEFPWSKITLRYDHIWLRVLLMVGGFKNGNHCIL